MALRPGSRIGVYDVLALIGEGGMGQVFRARDTRLNRDVALKVLPDALANDAERLARFTREAQTLASLNHPHIAQVHGLEEVNGVRALVMELVEGEDLAQRLQRGALPLDEAILLAKQIAEAIEAAHEQGIIHRDLKPANIKVRPDGTVKVLDFGLAKAMDPMGAAAAVNASQLPTITTPAMTRAGMILGTAAYMAPEQARGRAVDKRADIWAFGCILYEMLTGRRVFMGDETADVIAAVLREDVRWDALPAATPQAVAKLLRRCLQRDPRMRLRDAGDVRLELSEPSATSASMTPSRRPAWLWPVLAGAISGLVLGAAAMSNASRSIPVKHLWRLSVNLPDGWRVPTSAPRKGRTNAADSAIAISPDGQQLAFVATREGPAMLWVRPLDSLNAQMLEGSEGASSPFWAPDGTALGFFAEDKLKTIVLATRTVATLCDVDNPRGGTWGARDTIVFGDVSRPLQRIAASGGTPVNATMLRENERQHVRPAFLPDRVHFVYRAVTADSAPIRVGSIDDGTDRHLLDSDISNVQVASGRILYGRGGTLVSQAFDADRLTLSGEATSVVEQVAGGGNPPLAQFSVSAEGTLTYRALDPGVLNRGIAWLSRDGEAPREVGGVARYAEIDVSPDGLRVAASIAEASGVQARDIWILDLARNVPTRVTSSRLDERSPAWSPDGARIAFIAGSSQSTKHTIFVRPTDGSASPRPVAEVGGNAGGLSWVPDGTALLFASRSAQPGGGGDILSVSLSGASVPVPVIASEFDERSPAVSPDGRWLAYRSNESGSDEVHIVAFRRPGPHVQVSNGGGASPRWSVDGKEIFYTVHEGQTTNQPGRLMSASLAISGNRIEVGVPRERFTQLVAGNSSEWPYDVSPDGRRILAILPPVASVTPITVVRNWTASLARRGPSSVR